MTWKWAWTFSRIIRVTSASNLAIEIYKRTGSLTVLQQAMGHASLAVSLGYLRNLEVPMLKVEDMPMFNGNTAAINSR